jgi:hypothetical protein
MTSKENLNENLHKPISGIFAKKFMGPHCNALIGIESPVYLTRTENNSN